MQISGITYKNILKVALPIMLGSAGQNVVTLTDSVLLFHYDKVSFAAVGIVGIFYLTLNTIGYSLSKGGQIIIARRYGEKNLDAVRSTTQTLFAFQLFVSIFLFALFWVLSPTIFNLFISDPAIRELSLDYIYHRLPGLFFSYIGFVFIALYSALGWAKFILVDTIILLIVNLVFNYGLIFGHWGLPEMGLAGAAMASTIAEAAALVAFVIYVLFDKKIKQFSLFNKVSFHKQIAKSFLKISAPITVQSALSMGSWFIFFILIEKIGPDALAISNLVRIIYLGLSVPYWGFTSSVNTFVSTLIGHGKFKEAVRVVKKTIILCLIFTIGLSLPIVIYPVEILYPLLGTQDNQMLLEAVPVLWTLLGILIIMSIGGILYNAVVGTGDTVYGLKILVYSILPYMGLVVVVVYFKGPIELAWASEIAYWLVMFFMSRHYFLSHDWKNNRV